MLALEIVVSDDSSIPDDNKLHDSSFLDLSEFAFICSSLNLL